MPAPCAVLRLGPSIEAGLAGQVSGWPQWRQGAGRSGCQVPRNRSRASAARGDRSVLALPQTSAVPAFDRLAGGQHCYAFRPFFTTSTVENRLSFALDNTRLYRELSSQKLLLESILDTMAEAVYVAEPAGRLMLVNRAFTQLIGAKTKEEAWRSRAEFASLLNPRYEDGKPIPWEELPMSRALRGETFTDVVVLIPPFREKRDHYKAALSTSPYQSSS